jgi:hypothetical protein
VFIAGVIRPSFAQRLNERGDTPRALAAWVVVNSSSTS